MREFKTIKKKYTLWSLLKLLPRNLYVNNIRKTSFILRILKNLKNTDLKKNIFFICSCAENVTKNFT